MTSRHTPGRPNHLKLVDPGRTPDTLPPPDNQPAEVSVETPPYLVSLGLTSDDITAAGWESLGRVPSILQSDLLAPIMARALGMVAVVTVFDETAKVMRYVPVVIGEIDAADVAMSLGALRVQLEPLVNSMFAGTLVAASEALTGITQDYEPYAPVDTASLPRDGKGDALRGYTLGDFDETDDTFSDPA